MKIALLDAADTIARLSGEKSVQMQSLASRKCVFEAYEWDLCVLSSEVDSNLLQTKGKHASLTSS